MNGVWVLEASQQVRAGGVPLPGQVSRVERCLSGTTIAWLVRQPTTTYVGKQRSDITEPYQ